MPTTAVFGNESPWARCIPRWNTTKHVAVLDNIVDEIGQQETHPLADLAETLALSIEAYEDIHIPLPNTSTPAILRSLMEDHELTQSDLPEIGIQGVVSEILAGKRDLNVHQIAQLAERFSVSPAVFMPTSTNRHKPFPTKTRKSCRR
jgi:HTH-type transcriptional regulator/antitoxin HigA